MSQRLVIVSAFDPLVSDDILGCVLEWDASSIVHISASHDATARDLAGVPTVFAVVVRGQPECLDATGLPGLVADRGGRIVWVTDTPTHPARTDLSWIPVAMPFTSDMLRAALAAAAAAAAAEARGEDEGRHHSA